MADAAHGLLLEARVLTHDDRRCLLPMETELTLLEGTTGAEGERQRLLRKLQDALQEAETRKQPVVQGQTLDDKAFALWFCDTVDPPPVVIPLPDEGSSSSSSSAGTLALERSTTRDLVYPPQERTATTAQPSKRPRVEGAGHGAQPFRLLTRLPNDLVMEIVGTLLIPLQPSAPFQLAATCKRLRKLDGMQSTLEKLQKTAQHYADEFRRILATKELRFHLTCDFVTAKFNEGAFIHPLAWTLHYNRQFRGPVLSHRYLYFCGPSGKAVCRDNYSLVIQILAERRVDSSDTLQRLADDPEKADNTWQVHKVGVYYENTIQRKLTAEQQAAV